MNVISEGLLINGITKYNEKDYTSSYDLFINAAEVKAEVGVFDSLSYYYAARSAEAISKFDVARDLYKKVLEAGYTQPDVYAALATCYKELKDNENALKVLNEGRALYPGNTIILFAEINYFLATSQSDKAIADLEMAQTLEPNNPSIFFATGTQYDNLGRYEEAEKAYLKALEINPTYFDAIYNLGALHVNQAAKLMEKANAIPADKEKEYLEMKAIADGVLDKAIPFLEKAHLMDPSDKNTIRSLKEIYARKSMLDKVKEMDEKLK
jgi:tetratricopeptide (TPR) repeat protein